MDVSSVNSPFYRDLLRKKVHRFRVVTLINRGSRFRGHRQSHTPIGAYRKVYMSSPTILRTNDYTMKVRGTFK